MSLVNEKTLKAIRNEQKEASYSFLLAPEEEKYSIGPMCDEACNTPVKVSAIERDILEATKFYFGEICGALSADSGDSFEYVMKNIRKSPANGHPGKPRLFDIIRYAAAWGNQHQFNILGESSYDSATKFCDMITYFCGLYAVITARGSAEYLLKANPYKINHKIDYVLGDKNGIYFCALYQAFMTALGDAVGEISDSKGARNAIMKWHDISKPGNVDFDSGKCAMLDEINYPSRYEFKPDPMIGEYYFESYDNASIRTSGMKMTFDDSELPSAERLMKLIGIEMTEQNADMWPNGCEKEIAEFNAWALKVAKGLSECPTKWLLHDSQRVLHYLVNNAFYGDPFAAICYIIAVIDKEFEGEL